MNHILNISAISLICTGLIALLFILAYKPEWLSPEPKPRQPWRPRSLKLPPLSPYRGGREAGAIRHRFYLKLVHFPHTSPEWAFGDALSPLPWVRIKRLPTHLPEVNITPIRAFVLIDACKDDDFWRTYKTANLLHVLSLLNAARKCSPKLRGG